jgi:hypothetical protein
LQGEQAMWLSREGVQFDIRHGAERVHVGVAPETDGFHTFDLTPDDAYELARRLQDAAEAVLRKPEPPGSATQAPGATPRH